MFSKVFNIFSPPRANQGPNLGPNPAGTATFHHYRYLPKTMKVRIWDHIVENYEPAYFQIGFDRVNVLQPEVAAYELQISAGIDPPAGCDPPAPINYVLRRSADPPAASRVSSLSRKSFLRRYTHSFNGIRGGPVYFNFRDDWLHLSGLSFRWIESFWDLRRDLEHVRRLAIYSVPPLNIKNYRILLHFFRLEHLAIENIDGQDALRDDSTSLADFWRDIVNQGQLGFGFPVTNPPELYRMPVDAVGRFEDELREVPINAPLAVDDGFINISEVRRMADMMRGQIPPGPAQ